jgi:phage tail-like protein
MSDPQAAFSFAVSFDGGQGPADASFREVSGIASEMDVETVRERGENRFVHALPKGIKHPHLVLRRGTAGLQSELVQWCKSVLEGGLAQPIETKDLTLRLLDETGASLRTWKFQDAYPVLWLVDPFHADKKAVAIEKIELSYSASRRMP